MVALYKIKLKLNLSNKSLATFCGQMEEALIGETIYEVAICHFQISCQIPRKWLNPKMSDEDKDVIFNHFLSMQDPIYTQHLAPMKDPTGKRYSFFIWKKKIGQFNPPEISKVV